VQKDRERKDVTPVESYLLRVKFRIDPNNTGTQL